ncbi:unnamed protein product [Mycena citricolor]|uniref:Large ribosomal subunit protein mL59 domain-containing protein n=1 Tax=Mycena citricolor TaxID=2018698 RepID=A0AAD2HNS5_9AGAR|nr:unnamed protein product [Mycena citricolor]
MSTTAKFLHRELKALPRFVRRHGAVTETPTAGTVTLPNPFMPWKNPATGRWAPPKYSLRQQADLIKRAKATGTAHLLPPSVKLVSPELLLPTASTAKMPKVKGLRTKVKVEWDRRPKERVVAGAAHGARLYAAKRKMFKGSSLERHRKKRAWRTWVLLHDMRKRIRKFRTNYVHRKPNPLKPTRGTPKKLPF